jgi:hypothetical protein
MRKDVLIAMLAIVLLGAATVSAKARNQNCPAGEFVESLLSDGSIGCAVPADTNTQLTEAQVETFVTNGALDLYAGTTLDGSSISTGPHTVDTDTNLDQAGIEAFGFVTGPHTVDTDTTYTAGSQLQLIGTQFSVTPDPTFNSVTVNHDLKVGQASGTDDDYVYFDAQAEYLKWDNVAHRFALSDDLKVSSYISTGPLCSGNDICGGGLISSNDVRVGQGNPVDDDYVYFDSSQEHLLWDESANRFDLSNDLRVQDNLQVDGVIRSPNGQFSISVTDSGIVLSGPTGSIEIDNSKIEINGVNIDVHASGTLDMQGSPINLN